MDYCLKMCIAIPLFTDVLLQAPVFNVQQKQTSYISLLIFLCSPHPYVKYTVLTEK
jgi:hypothetical protein